MDSSDRPLILITGCARSGTSLTAQVLEACGAKLGRVNDLYEHTGVRDELVKPFLSSIGADPLGQSSLPEDGYRFPGDWPERVEAQLGAADTYKGAKMALVWPLWRAAFPQARWVICHRNAHDIAASCMRTRFMQAFDTQEDWREWALRYKERLTDLQRAVEHVAVWPQDAIIGDAEVYRPVVEHCGLTWNREAVQAVIHPNAWHA